MSGIAPMRATVLAFVLLAAAIPAAQSAEPSSSAAKELHALFESEWERGLRENPVGASYQGDRRYDDRWADLSADALARSHATDRAVLEANVQAWLTQKAAAPGHTMQPFRNGSRP